MKVADKLKKVDESMTVNKFNNGYMVEIGGRDEDDDWSRIKVVCNNLEEVLEIIREYDTFEVVS